LIELIHELVWPLVTVLMPSLRANDCSGNHLLQLSQPLLGHGSFAECGCDRDQTAVIFMTAFP